MVTVSCIQLGHRTRSKTGPASDKGEGFHMVGTGLRRWMAALGVVAGLGVAQLIVTGAEAADKIKVGFSPEPYAPFWVQDASGKWSGFEVDFIDALFKQMGKEYEL